MMFSLGNPRLQGKKTHAGVLEFTADEGYCYVPFWMMQNLLIEEGGFIVITNVTLPKGSYVKVQPQSTAFIDISNPKAVLENRFRNFSCLTQGDIIAIEYNKKIHHLGIIELKPASAHRAVSIVETDIQLDFAPPLDYVDPSTTQLQAKPAQTSVQPNLSSSSSSSTMSASQKLEGKSEKEDVSEDSKKDNFQAFVGTGYTLSGKKLGTSATNSNNNTKSSNSTAAPISTPQKESFSTKKKDDSDDEAEFVDPKASTGSFKAFSGAGYSLRK